MNLKELTMDEFAAFENVEIKISDGVAEIETFACAWGDFLSLIDGDKENFSQKFIDFNFYQKFFILERKISYLAQLFEILTYSKPDKLIDEMQAYISDLKTIYQHSKKVWNTHLHIVVVYYLVLYYLVLYYLVFYLNTDFPALDFPYLDFP